MALGSDEFEVFFKDLDGNTHSIAMKAGADVKALKAAIAKERRKAKEAKAKGKP